MEGQLRYSLTGVAPITAKRRTRNTRQPTRIYKGPGLRKVTRTPRLTPVMRLSLIALVAGSLALLGATSSVDAEQVRLQTGGARVEKSWSYIDCGTSSALMIDVCCF